MPSLRRGLDDTEQSESSSTLQAHHSPPDDPDPGALQLGTITALKLLITLSSC